MALNTLKLSARNTESRLAELLNEWFKKYFTGTPHISNQGDTTFPLVDLFFNQTQIDTPEDRPQLHFVFSRMQPTETWWANGNLADWVATINRPASGVSYGLARGGIEESVHGKLARFIPEARDIRWRTDGADLFEEVLRGGWEIERTFAGSDAIRWRRVAGNYLEEVRTTGSETWMTARSILTSDPIWDGTKKLVVIEATILLFVRTINAGESGEQGDHICRRVADNAHELISDEAARAELTQKGFRRFRVSSGPTPMASSGFQTRMLTLDANLRYFLPREH